MTTDNSTPNMEWLLSAPLLEAALAQIKSMDQFQALMDSYYLAEKNGQQIPGKIKAKLGGKQIQLVSHIDRASLRREGENRIVDREVETHLSPCRKPIQIILIDFAQTG